MANILDHRFRSSKADGGDASQVQPSHWNDGHAFQGGAAGQVLVRDPLDALYGANWAPHGQWTDLPFNPAEFHGSGAMTWTVSAANVALRAYTIIGATCLVAFGILNSTTSGGDLILSFDLPASLRALPGGETNMVRLEAGGTWRAGIAFASNNEASVKIALIDVGAFPAGGFSIQGELLFRLG